MFFDEKSMMARVETYMSWHTRGNNYPKEIWLNKEDYMQLLKELKAIQRYNRGHEVLEVPENKVKVGFRAVYFNGAEVIYNPTAPSLPEESEDIKNWENKRWESDVY